MIIRITGQSGEKVFPFQSSGPWRAFETEIVSQGHLIEGNGVGTRIDALISNKHSKKYIREANRNKIPISKRTLVIWEPKVVFSKNYAKKVLRQYGNIYAPSPIWARKVKGKYFKWPQDELEILEDYDTWALRENRFVVIQGNKFSALEGEMYSLRRRTIFELGENIDLYGNGWNQGFWMDLISWIKSAIKNFPSKISWKTLFGVGLRQRSYRGISQNKIETLSRYRLALVIENSTDFVSEKLFDCVSAGCLVIYIGPNLDQFNLDHEVVLSASADINAILSRCKSILSLSADQQYAIVKSQNESLRRISSDWVNTSVLCELGRTILRDMN